LGIEYRLTRQQIAEAEAVIWTTDLKIREQRRFKGKKLLHKYTASAVIKHTDQLLDDALALANSDTPAE